MLASIFCRGRAADGDLLPGVLSAVRFGHGVCDKCSPLPLGRRLVEHGLLRLSAVWRDGADGVKSRACRHRLRPKAGAGGRKSGKQRGGVAGKFGKGGKMGQAIGVRAGGKQNSIIIVSVIIKRWKG